MITTGYTHHIKIIDPNHFNNDPDTSDLDDEYSEGCTKLGIEDNLIKNFEIDSYVQAIGEIAYKHFAKALEPVLRILPFHLSIEPLIVDEKIACFSDSIEIVYKTHDDLQKNVATWLDSIESLDDLQRFIKENYGSYDGFCSFFPQSVANLLMDANDTESQHRVIAVVLAYSCHLYYSRTNGIDSIQSDFIDDVNSVITASDYYSVETIQAMRDVINKAMELPD